ncbi:MAG TPA: sporulation protein [Candidatus Eisenbacteria bacterium]|nr:sporulation protein [Candidatus Eisenbacteria bacterium]
MTTAEELARQAAENDLGSRILERLVSQVGGHARAEAVFGDPVERDGVTVIPVARVRWGVGGGGGSAVDGAGSGGGGGLAADPIGYIEITSAGASFRPIARSFGAAGILAVAIAAVIVIRALARLRR